MGLEKKEGKIEVEVVIKIIVVGFVEVIIRNLKVILNSLILK